MKRLFIAVLLVTFMITGCSGINLKGLGGGDTDIIGIYAVETAAVLIGYYAAQSPAADKALRGLYDLAVEGKLSPAAINTILTTLGASDPIAVLMVRRAVRLAEMMGATVEGGSIVSLAGRSPELVEAAKIGYLDGYDTYKATE